MYSKRIKYEDFDRTQREETFYFNLTEAELIEMQSSVPGGLAAYGKRIIECKNVPEIMDLFKKLILISYGEKSADGRRFIKEDPVRGKLSLEFMQTNAYSELYMEFINHPESGVEFFNNFIPASIRDAVDPNEIEAATGQAWPPAVTKA